MTCCRWSLVQCNTCDLAIMVPWDWVTEMIPCGVHPCRHNFEYYCSSVGFNSVGTLPALPPAGCPPLHPLCLGHKHKVHITGDDDESTGGTQQQQQPQSAVRVQSGPNSLPCGGTPSSYSVVGALTTHWQPVPLAGLLSHSCTPSCARVSASS
jgi:hypothetical protein